MAFPIIGVAPDDQTRFTLISKASACKTCNPPASTSPSPLFPAISDGLRVSREKRSFWAEETRGLFASASEFSRPKRREGKRLGGENRCETTIANLILAPFHIDPPSFPIPRPDKLSSSTETSSYSSARDAEAREEKIQSIPAALIERDRIRPRVKDRADTDCAILIYSWEKKGLAFVQFPIRATSLPIQRGIERERER